MTDHLNKKIVLLGTLSTLIWVFVMMMSKGLPVFFCQWLDAISFQMLTKEIMQMTHGFYYQVNNNDMPTVIYIGFFMICFLIMLYLVRRLEKNKRQDFVLGWIVLFSILFRCVLLPAEPIHENDFYRYLWDGKSANHGINPFKYAPADLSIYEAQLNEDFLDFDSEEVQEIKEFREDDFKKLDHLIELRDQNYLFYERIGHQEVPTIYPPVAQGIFAGITFLWEDHFVFMKIIFMLFDIGVIFLIIALLSHLKLNPCMVIIYGWSPLVLKEFAISGHYDSIPIFFTTLSLFLLVKGKQLGGSVFLAMAALSKFFSGLLLPLYFRKMKFIYLFCFALICVVFYVPYVLWNDTGLHGVFKGLHVYNQEWNYNSSVFAGVYLLLDKFMPQLTNELLNVKLIVAGIYGLIVLTMAAIAHRNDLDFLHKCFLAIALLFIFNPVGDPWYFCWAIPLLCLFPYRSWIWLSGLLILSYLNFHSDLGVINDRWLDIPIISWVIYIPFFLYVLFELVTKKCKVNDILTTK